MELSTYALNCVDEKCWTNEIRSLKAMDNKDDIEGNNFKWKAKGIVVLLAKSV